MSNPTRAGSLGDGLICDIWDRDGFRPMSEVVNADEQIGVSSGGWERFNKINVDVVNENVRAGKG